MRRLSFVLVLLLAAIPAFAQQQPNAIYVFVTNPGGGSTTQGGSFYEGEVGVAFQRMLADRWSVEGAIARKYERDVLTHFDSNGNVIETRVFTTHSTPIDVTGRYHFLNGTSWKPYVDVGARWTNSSVDDRVLATAGGGVAWQFSRTLALRLDGKVFFGNRPAHLDSVNASFGLGWRF